MRFIDYIKLALRNVRRQKLRSVLTIFAVVIGATSVVIMLSLVVGAKTIFLRQIEDSGALTQVVVTSSTDLSSQEAFGGGGGNSDSTSVKLTDVLADKVRAINHVQAVHPMLGVYELQTFTLEGSDKKINTHGAIGYEPGPDNDKKLVAGRNLTANDHKNVIIFPGRYIEKVGFKSNPNGLIGKTLVFTMYQGYSGDGAELPKPTQRPDGGWQFPNQEQMPIVQLKAVVIGVTPSGGDQDDRMYLPLEWAKAIMGRQQWRFDEAAQKAFDQARQTNHNATPPQPVLVTESDFDRRGYDTLNVKVDATSNVEGVATEVRKLGVGAATAKDIIAQFESTFKIVALVLGAIGAISLVVAAIGVINTMVMAILERTREIGVMRATGATRKTIRRLFTFEAALLGFLGGAFGVAVGIGLSKVANHFINQALITQNASGRNLIAVPWWLALSVIGTTTLIGMLAGLYPAFRAARLNPVEALRYE